MRQFLLFMLVVSTLNANGQGFSGVQTFLSDIVLHPTFYTGGKASIGKMAFDNANNKYILGWFDGILDVDPGPNTRSDTSFGNSGNLFVLKEDAAGNFVWAKQFAAQLPNSEIDVDASGNIYIAGSTRDSVDMDPGPGVYRFSTGGGSVAFILKLDASGNFVWAKGHEVDTISSWSFINGMKVIGDAIYATGAFVGTVDLDPGPGIYNVTVPPGEKSMLLIKMDTAGKFIWGKPIAGKGLNYLNAFATDSAANLYIAGEFQDTVDFDPGPGVYALTATPWAPGFPFGYNSDIFVAKYDSAGNLAWAHAFGAHYSDKGKGVAVDRFGNVFVTGSYTPLGWDAVDFDPGPGMYNLSPYRSEFLLKLRSNGDFAWAKNAGGSNLIATDDSGNVYASAVQKLDSSGKDVWPGQWVAGSGSWGRKEPAWMGLDKNDTIYVSGSFSGINDFDPGEGVFYLGGLPYATQSGFILKLSQIPNPWHGAGLNGTSLQTAINVYPNPSSGIVTFSSPLAIHRIELTDMAGRVVYVNEPNQAKTIIDLRGKAAGVYFYEVECGSGKQRGKLVIH